MDTNRIIVSPYDTTYGKLLKMDTVTKELMRYAASVDTDALSYEYNKIDEKKIVSMLIITGYNNDEKSLPIFNHPLIFKGIKNQIFVAVDLRKYLRQMDTQPAIIMDYAKDVSSVEFIMLRALITASFAMGEMGVFRPIFKSASSAMALFISNVINAIVLLDPAEKLSIEVAVCHYINIMLTDTDDISDIIDAIESRIVTTKLSINSPSRSLIHIIMEKLDNNVKDLNGLVENIKRCLPEGKRDLITQNVLINMFSNLWFGPGATESLVMSIEHMPTWFALVYSAMGDNTYKRSRLATALMKFSRQIDPKEYTKFLSNWMKEHTN